MEYELRTERARSDDREGLTWHMTGAGGTQALCGAALDPSAETLAVEAWGSDEAEPFCRVCGAQYLRQGL